MNVKGLKVVKGLKIGLVIYFYYFRTIQKLEVESKLFL